jgi:hypothetical protein
MDRDDRCPGSATLPWATTVTVAPAGLRGSAGLGRMSADGTSHVPDQPVVGTKSVVSCLSANATVSATTSPGAIARRMVLSAVRILSGRGMRRLLVGAGLIFAFWVLAGRVQAHADPLPPTLGHTIQSALKPSAGLPKPLSHVPSAAGPNTPKAPGLAHRPAARSPHAGGTPQRSGGGDPVKRAPAAKAPAGAKRHGTSTARPTSVRPAANRAVRLPRSVLPRDAPGLIAVPRSDVTTALRTVTALGSNDLAARLGDTPPVRLPAPRRDGTPPDGSGSPLPCDQSDPPPPREQGSPVYGGAPEPKLAHAPPVTEFPAGCDLALTGRYPVDPSTHTAPGSGYRTAENREPLARVPVGSVPFEVPGSTGGGGGGQVPTGTGDVSGPIPPSLTLWNIVPEATPRVSRTIADEPSFSPD